MALAYEVSSPPRAGTVRLAGWAPGSSGLKFFASEEEAAGWLGSPLNAGSRLVLRLTFAEVERLKLVVPPAPYLEAE
jgi:hypothetical protein